MSEREPSENSEFKTLSIPQLNTSKLLFLGLLAFMFASLEPFALFASIPFSLSFLLYGKKKTIGIGILGTALAVVLMQVQFYQGSAIGTFPLAVIYGYLISGIIRGHTDPLFGVVRSGLGIFVLFMIMIVAFHFQTEGGIQSFLNTYVHQAASTYYKSLESTQGVELEQLRHFQDVIDDPSIVTSPVIKYGTGAIFIGVFISFWVGTFIILRMAPLWNMLYQYPYNVKTLTSFKVPFILVWPLIACLVLCVGNVYEVFGSWADIIGFNGLLMLGVFYFFQGFGILSELLNHWRIFGFFRTTVIFFTVVMAYQVLALVGVLDTWVDFRRFFNKKNDEGDQS